MHEPTITFSGNLAAKPECKTIVTAQGPTFVANLRIAVTPRKRARDAEEWSDGETMWFSVSTWRTTAVNAAASLNQGDRVAVRGRLTQRTWTDANGVERPQLEVEAEDVALDITRHPAMSVRGRPGGTEWTTDGRVDRETGEVAVVAQGDAPEQEAEPVAV